MVRDWGLEMRNYKGIVLAGGSGTRLYPLTKGVSKQLMPVYDKPMIYYSLSVLLLAGIKEVMIITTPDDQLSFIKTLGCGKELGISITYKVQERPEGIAQAFLIAEDFIGDSNVCLILGDNIFWGQGFSTILTKVKENNIGATVFGYKVKDPERFGVVEFDSNNKVVSIEEKPAIPSSDYAVTGLYFYTNEVIKISKEIKPSQRGELEITTVNQCFLDKDLLSVELLGRGFAWLDTGTHDSLLEASSFVETIEKRQGYKIACLEEICWRNGWISDAQLKSIATSLSKNSYGQYLLSIV
jgi:glucose-1-phosphate thymidylyltransferase